MEEKERYDLKIYAGCESYSITDTKEKQQITLKNVINLLNKQDKRIKELEEELDDAKRDYIPKLEFGLQRANKMGRDAEKEIQQLKQQLHDLPKKIVEEIKDKIPEIGGMKCEIIIDDFLTLNTLLDTILKKYGANKNN